MFLASYFIDPPWPLIGTAPTIRCNSPTKA
jgi:hypothetical protein